nr:SusC/RagA family TonB-linked outer membrane protein [Odoribacter splanchnicus]
MKLTVFLILLGLLRVSAVTNAQVYRINLELENVACEGAIESLKGQTNLDFFFSNREVNVNRKVSVSCKNASLEEALKQILGEGYSFRLIDNTVVIRPVKNQLPQPKQVTVKGTVKDVKGNPLPGVTVLLKGSALGISTDNDGKFTVSFPEMKDVVLLFSFIGMKSQEVKYTGQTDIKVVLEEDVKEMDEVIVTGIMERKAESFTGSATVVKGDDLKRVGNTNIFQSLKNLDPTVFVMDNLDMGSNPNALPEMNMRGGTSFPGGEIDSDLKGNYENKPNQPLFILDGFEVSAETVFDLDMQRVESLTILKDASAKAIYGSKAANGVVVIETKRLDSNKPRFSYTGSLDLNMPDLSSYDLCNALEKLDVEFTEGVYDVNNPNDMKKYYALCKKALEGLDTYWLSKPVQFGYGHKHSLMIELGKDELRTSLNFSYSNNVGIMKKSGRENLSGAFNLQYNYKNKLRFQNQASFTQNKSEDTPYGSFSTYAVLNPYEDMYDENGLLAIQIGDRPNPYRDGEIGTSLTSSYRQFINNTSLEWTIIEGLRLRGKLGITVKNNDADQFYPASHSKFANYTGENAVRKGSYQVNNGKSSTLSGELLLNWYKQFNEKHNLFVNLGYNLSETISSEVINYTEGFPSDNMNDIMFATQYMKDKRPSGISQTKRDIGILGTVSYTYLDKYLFDFTLRSNGSSMFGNDKRWATFWSTGIGWNLHKEAFLSNVEWLNTLKLRASIGTTGNQNFQNNKSIAINGYYTADRYRGAIGSYLQNMKNPDLKWEQKLDYNIGLDAVFMGVDIRMDFYKSITKDLVSSVGIAPSTGFTTVSENLGKVENKGFEILASYTPWQSRDGFVRINGSIAYNKDKILKISDAMRQFNDNQAALAANTDQALPVAQYQDGLSMNTIFAVPSLGIDPAIGLEMYRKQDGSSTYIWRDTDRVPCGVSVPLYRGTVGITGEYKGIGISITGRYLGGGQMYNNTLVSMVENADITQNFDRRVLTERWNHVGHEAFFKRYKSRTPYDLRNGIYWYSDDGWIQYPTQATSRFVQDQKEFDLSSISVYYDFKREWIAKIGFERLRMTALMNEVTKISSIKIERGTTYPFSRTLTFQLSATF